MAAYKQWYAMYMEKGAESSNEPGEVEVVTAEGERSCSCLRACRQEKKMCSWYTPLNLEERTQKRCAAGAARS